MNKETILKIKSVLRIFVPLSIVSILLLITSFGARKNELDRRVSKKLFEIGLEPKIKTEQLIIPDEMPSLPNIIIILVDDLGYGDIGSYGSTAIQTPYLDRMAKEGMQFTDFYCSSPLCSPSRAGLLTGRYPIRSGLTFPLQPGKDTFTRKLVKEAAYAMGVLGVVDMKNAKNLVKGLPQSEITIAEALKIQGYTTAAFGKWHLGDFVIDMEHHPYNHGFDSFVGFNASNDDWPASFWVEDKQIVEDIALNQGEYTERFTDEAINFIQNSGEKPFFIYLAHKDPHQPCIPSDKFAGLSDAGAHGDTIMELDWNTGRIFDQLKELGIDDETLVIFTSDNGPWFDGSSGGLRGRKGETFEGGFRVPMIVRWPGTVPAETVNRNPSSNLDIFPTLMELTGLTLPSDRIIDGRDLSNEFKGAITTDPKAIYFFHYNEVEAVRVDNWKHIRSTNTRSWPIPMDKKNSLFGKLAGGADYKPEGSNESVPTLAKWPMLYNMDTDPQENYNLSDRKPEIQTNLNKQIENFEADFFKNPRGWID